MIASLRRPASILALAAFAAAGLAGTRVSAQMIPRLVSYTRASATTTPCKADAGPSLGERRTVVYGRQEWKETVTVYADAACSAQAVLLTLDSGGTYGPQSSRTVVYRTATPTVAGQAYLQRACAQYAWMPGVAQDVTSGTCDALAVLSSATGSP